jgi:tetratricopeptide (TPR) repeat protein
MNGLGGLTAISEPDVLEVLIDLATDSIRKADSNTLQFLRLVSSLAPTRVPKVMLARGSHALSEPLQSVLGAPEELARMLGVLESHRLIDNEVDTFALTSAVQGAIRERMSNDERLASDAEAAQMIVGAFPSRPDNWRAWLVTSAIVPHAIAVADSLDGQQRRALLESQLRREVGRYFVGTGDWQDAHSCFARAMAICERADASGTDVYATCLVGMATVRLAEGHFADAQALVERAIRVQRTLDLETASLADSYAKLAEIAGKLGNNGDAYEHATAALKMHQAIYGEVSIEVAEDHLMLANIFMQQTAVAQARVALVAGTGVLEKLYGADDADVQSMRFVLQQVDAAMRGTSIDVVTARANVDRLGRAYGDRHYAVAEAQALLAGHLMDHGKFTDARSALQAALDIHRETYGPHHYEVAADRFQLAVTAYALGHDTAALGDIEAAANALKRLGIEAADAYVRLARLDDALARLSRLENADARLLGVINALRSVLGPDHVGVAVALTALGDVHLSRGNIQAAGRSLKGALALFTAARGEGDPAVADTLNRLATVDETTHQYVPALERRLAARELHVARFGETHSQVANDDFAIAANLLATGQLDDARTRLLTAESTYETLFGSDYPLVARIRWQAAELLKRLGDSAGAIKQLEAAEHTLQRSSGLEQARSQRLAELGALRRSMGDSDRAKHDLEEALRLHGDDAPTGTHLDTLLLLALLHSERSDLDESRSLLERTRNIVDSPAYSLEDAQTRLRQIVDIWAKLADSLVVAGRLQDAHSEYERAMTVAETTATTIDDASITFRMGFVEQFLGQEERAAQHIRQSLDLLTAQGLESAPWHARTNFYASMIGLLGPSAAVETILASEEHV